MPLITVHLNAPRIGVILRRLHLKIKAFASVLLLDEDMPVDYSDFWMEILPNHRQDESGMIVAL